MTEATDWDAYYKKPVGAANVSRAITRRKLTRTLRQFLEGRLSVCEMGGANSCVLAAVCESLDVDSYHICDTNAYGLSLLPTRQGDTTITSTQSDVLKRETERHNKFDLVLSIGLIEHFDVEETRRAILSHVDACKPGGFILLTFPTPTLLYRLIRKSAELLGLWKFHDERPLSAAEVLSALSNETDIKHQSINWFIGLTQYYIVAQKRS